MEVRYRRLFIKHVKRLKGQPIYRKIIEIAFEALPTAKSIHEIPNIKPMKGYPGRYRIRIGRY